MNGYLTSEELIQLWKDAYANYDWASLGLNTIKLGGLYTIPVVLNSSHGFTYNTKKRKQKLRLP